MRWLLFLTTLTAVAQSPLDQRVQAAAQFHVCLFAKNLDTGATYGLREDERVRIVVNGEATDTAARTLAELIASLGFAEGSVATAHNGEFVSRSARDKTCLGTGDKIEIVAPRQGG